MDDDRVPKQLLFSELEHGSRPVGRPKLRFKDILKKDLKIGSVLEAWCYYVYNRKEWRAITNNICTSYDKRKYETYSKRRDAGPVILETMSNSDDDLFIAQNTFDIIPLTNFDIDDLLSDLELRMLLPANNDDKVCRWEKMRKITIVFDVELARKTTREGFKKKQTKVPNGRVYVLG
ncbi:hypothetical protein AC249_AIPGENE16688 [Exaiptasia diaphana]|nr:hypothetical protein AC249_AIPGENE16688 [Exaiptasia diaphana]